jgi:hypothetical protein
VVCVPTADVWDLLNFLVSPVGGGPKSGLGTGMKARRLIDGAASSRSIEDHLSGVRPSLGGDRPPIRL